jgi:transcriptional regulator with XRE-family HTH domain
MPELRELGQRLKSVHNAYGITQEQFAKLMGVSRVTVRHWEAGRRDFSKRLPEIAAVLGCAEMDLLNIDGPIPPAAPRRKKPTGPSRQNDNITGLLVTQVAALIARVDSIEWRLDRLAGEVKRLRGEKIK